MKKITLSALAAFAVVGTAVAGPSVVMSKEYKQPCVTPCFRDMEFQLDLFYSFNDASHEGTHGASDVYSPGLLPTATPIPTTTYPFINPLLSTTSPAAVVPAGSTVTPTETVNAGRPQYFNDGSGGGVGLNFFFARYFGFSLEGNWWDGIRGNFNGDFTSTDLVTPSVAYTPATFLALQNAANAIGSTATLLPNGQVVLTTPNRFANTHRTTANQVTGNFILRYPFEGPVCWAPYVFVGGGGVFDGGSTGFGDVGLGVEFRVTPYMGFFTDWRWEFMGSGGNNDDFDNNARIAALVAFNNGLAVTLPNGTVVTGTAFQNVRNLNAPKRNDVNMTRIGIRFVF